MTAVVTPAIVPPSRNPVLLQVLAVVMESYLEPWFCKLNLQFAADNLSQISFLAFDWVRET